MTRPLCVGSACSVRAAALIEEARWGDDTARSLSLALQALAFAAHDPVMWVSVVRALRESGSCAPGLGDNELRVRLATLAEAIHADQTSKKGK